VLQAFSDTVKARMGRCLPKPMVAGDDTGLLFPRSERELLRLGKQWVQDALRFGGMRSANVISIVTRHTEPRQRGPKPSSCGSLWSAGQIRLMSL